MTTPQLIVQLLHPVRTGPAPTLAGGDHGEFLQLLNALTSPLQDGTAPAAPEMLTLAQATVAEQTPSPSSAGKSLNILLWAALAQVGRRPIQGGPQASASGVQTGSTDCTPESALVTARSVAAEASALDAPTAAKADLAQTLEQVRTAIQTAFEDWRGQLPARLEAAHARVERAEELYTRLFELIDQIPGEEAEEAAEAIAGLAEALGRFEQRLAALVEQFPADGAAQQTPASEEAEAATEAIGGLAEALDRFNQVLAVLVGFFPADGAASQAPAEKDTGNASLAPAHAAVATQDGTLASGMSEAAEPAPGVPADPVPAQSPLATAKWQPVARLKAGASVAARAGAVTEPHKTPQEARPVATDDVRDLRARAERAVDDLARAVERVARASTAFKPNTVMASSARAAQASVSVTSPDKQDAGPVRPVNGENTPEAKVEATAAVPLATVRRTAQASEPRIPDVSEAVAGRGREVEVTPVHGVSAQATSEVADTATSRAGSAIRLLAPQASEEIVRHAVTMVRAGRSEMSVRLDPPELGTLRLVVKQVQDQTQILLRVESAAAHEFIREHVGQLQNGFGDNGLGTVRVQVDLVGSSAAGQPSQFGLWHGGTSQQSYHAPSEGPVASTAEPGLSETLPEGEPVHLSDSSLVDLLA